MKKTYFLLKTPSPSLLENKSLLISKAMDSFGCQGVEEANIEENILDEHLPPSLLYQSSHNQSEEEKAFSLSLEKIPNVLIFYFYGDNSLENKNSFKEFLKEFSLTALEEKECSWEDWNNSWKKNFVPFNIAETFCVIPEWHTSSHVTSLIPLILYPGMGFGTGHHFTTQLCLKALAQYSAGQLSFQPSPIFSILDLGCGSGILAIAAKKLYPEAFFEAIDIEPEALDNCLYNLRLNFSSENSLVNCSLRHRNRFVPNKRYNIIFANILANVLLEEYGLIKKCLEKNGILVLSGILDPQVKEVRTLYDQLGQLKKQFSQDGWSCLVYEGH